METSNDKKGLENAINTALDTLYENDKYLIDSHLHEQCIAFRFGLYLYQLIQKTPWCEYNLDMEYNKNMGSGKYIPSRRKGVRPDLILHKRDSNQHNILIIEFKKGENKSLLKSDVKKISDFIDPNGEYKYKFGAAILLTPNRKDVVVQWGEEKEKRQYKVAPIQFKEI